MNRGSPSIAGAVVATLLLTCAPGAATAAARGWPSVADGTLVSDVGSPLRGPRWVTDISGGALPSQQDVVELRDKGFNALHLYAEAVGCGYGAGDYLEQAKTLRDYTRDAGLYLVITIGNGSAAHCPGHIGWTQENGYQSFDLTFDSEFWTEYAEEFAGDSHVIFEVHNEPHFNPVTRTSQPSPPETRNLQKEIYELIRSQQEIHSPPGQEDRNPILLFSYGTFKDASAVLQDIAWLNANAAIDWSNTAIAFHMYESTNSQTRATIEAVAASYPVMQTEMRVDDCLPPPAPPLPCVQNADRTSIHEETRTSWLTFLDINHINDPGEFQANLRDPIDGGEVIWAADFGTWPATSSPPVGSTIALKTPAPYGGYVQADLGVDPVAPPLIADGGAMSLDTQFEVLGVGGGVALRSRENDKYVTADPQGFLRASAGSPVSFEWLDRADGKVALRPRAETLFVRADHGLARPKLVANQPRGGGAWEGFEIGSCAPPASGDWIVSESCTFAGVASAPADVIVQDGAELTIAAGAQLDIAFASRHLEVKAGGRVIVKAGGKIH